MKSKVFVVGYHMFEGLYSLDESLNPIPMLAADLPEISEDNHAGLRK